jgi:hypothetical protein
LICDGIYFFSNKLLDAEQVIVFSLSGLERQVFKGFPNSFNVFGDFEISFQKSIFFYVQIEQPDPLIKNSLQEQDFS